jgi:hypothetical protein
MPWQFHESYQERFFPYPFPFIVAFFIRFIIALGAERRIGLTNRQLSHLKDGLLLNKKIYGLQMLYSEGSNNRPLSWYR